MSEPTTATEATVPNVEMAGLNRKGMMLHEWSRWTRE
jgi:hypothetical protein